LGTPFINRVLAENEREDLAYAVLFKDTYPSWFFSINQGATTMWERWNSYSHEDGFGPVGMNSFNHYAYGAIGQWLYEHVAGLAPDPERPGYKHILLQPLPHEPLTSASAKLETPYGPAESSWELDGDQFKLKAVIPPNATGTVTFPYGAADQIRFEGESLTDRVDKDKIGNSVAGLVTVELEPGTYNFTTPVR